MNFNLPVFGQVQIYLYTIGKRTAHKLLQMRATDQAIIDSIHSHHRLIDVFEF